jgi:hypothetical protein
MKKEDGGMGAGPDEVWNEDFLLTVGEEQSQIHTDEHSLLMSPSAFAAYEGASAEHSHTYAEVSFKPADGTSDGYNFVVLARLVDDGPSKKFYQVKAVKQWLWACRATLFIINAGEAADLGAHVAAMIQSPPSTCQTCADYPVPAGACLQMDEGDPEPDFSSDTVWLRIKVKNTTDPHPKITGTLAWDCTDNQPINDCTNKFQIEREDAQDDDGMLGISGIWALESHDESYLIDLFRAGSQPE